ncbi:hypothetical protein T492DRAFT_941045 [Pavlovales sp. CCMP2436]|nr:hypothetical protein T492DRAFT_941045 [Pavlovales sp. CCMP2436]|mmetsp:Transcript_16788/g.42860  ORF Transcript_16788/g.42860 Transcript_16788/m.42860 type:complete len:204 (+) Transcript_16788:60-671(+)
MSLLARLARLGARAQLHSLAPARLASAVSRGFADKPPKAPKPDKPPKERAAAELAPKPPKKALSAYLFYIKDALIELKAGTPNAKPADLMKAAAARYAALKIENPAALAKYVVAAAADKERAAEDKPPKRARSAYLFYIKDVLIELKAETPDAKQTDLMKAAAARYAALKIENPAALAKYVVAAATDKERAAADLARWNGARK